MATDHLQVDAGEGEKERYSGHDQSAYYYDYYYYYY